MTYSIIFSWYHLNPLVKPEAISDAALAVVMLVAWDQDVDFDDLLGHWDHTTATESLRTWNMAHLELIYP